MATVVNGNLLEQTAGKLPVNAALIAHAAQLGIENSAQAQALVGSGGTVTATPASLATPAGSDPSVASMTGSLAQYATQYGLLAGGIVAVLIIGTVVVKKLVKKKK